jgi:hypothetical protein
MTWMNLRTALSNIAPLPRLAAPCTGAAAARSSDKGTVMVLSHFKNRFRMQTKCVCTPIWVQNPELWKHFLLLARGALSLIGEAKGTASS